jgi:hypothetical protein
MIDTITHFLEAITEGRWRNAIRSVVVPIGDRYSTQVINTAGLVIDAGSVTAKIGAADFYAMAKGVTITIAAGTTMPVLTGLNVTATRFNVFCFFADSAAVVTVAMGTQGTSWATVVWPPFPLNKVLVGGFLINYASTFTGNTTHLDTAGVVYFNGGGPFDPSVLV